MVLISGRVRWMSSSAHQYSSNNCCGSYSFVLARLISLLFVPSLLLQLVAPFNTDWVVTAYIGRSISTIATRQRSCNGLTSRVTSSTFNARTGGRQTMILQFLRDDLRSAPTGGSSGIHWDSTAGTSPRSGSLNSVSQQQTCAVLTLKPIPLLMEMAPSVSSTSLSVMNGSREATTSSSYWGKMFACRTPFCRACPRPPPTMTRAQRPHSSRPLSSSLPPSPPLSPYCGVIARGATGSDSSNSNEDPILADSISDQSSEDSSVASSSSSSSPPMTVSDTKRLATASFKSMPALRRQKDGKWVSLLLRGGESQAAAGGETSSQGDDTSPTQRRGLRRVLAAINIERLLRVSNFASILCVLDCTLLPLLTLLLPLLTTGMMAASTTSTEWLHAAGHAMALYFVLPVGGMATTLNYMYAHRTRWIAAVGYTGMVLIWAANSGIAAGSSCGHALHAVHHHHHHHAHEHTAKAAFWTATTVGRWLLPIFQSLSHGLTHQIANLTGCAFLMTSNYLSRRRQAELGLQHSHNHDHDHGESCGCSSHEHND